LKLSRDRTLLTLWRKTTRYSASPNLAEFTERDRWLASAFSFKVIVNRYFDGLEMSKDD
jgi:hypothetical protein